MLVYKQIRQNTLDIGHAVIANLAITELSYSTSTHVLTVSSIDNVTNDVVDAETGLPYTSTLTTTMSFNIADILNRSDCSDHTVYGIDFGGNIINFFSETYLTKRTISDYLVQNSFGVFMNIIIPSKSNIDGVIISIPQNPGDQLSLSGDLTLSENILNKFSDVLPTVTLGTPINENGIISIPVSVSDSSVTTYFKTNAGSLLINKLTSNGSVVISTVGVPAGTSITLKAGFKYFTNKANVTVTV